MRKGRRWGFIGAQMTRREIASATAWTTKPVGWPHDAVNDGQVGMLKVKADSSSFALGRCQRTLSRSAAVKKENGV
jgi:hypothetical protein